MTDFVELWDLRQRLIDDGFYSEIEDAADGSQMANHIAALASYHYGWKQCAPQSVLMGEARQKIICMQTPLDRISTIYSIACSIDENTSVREAMHKFDLIRNYAVMFTRREEVVEKDCIRILPSQVNKFMEEHMDELRAEGYMLLTIDCGIYNAFVKWGEKNGYQVVGWTIRPLMNNMDIEIKEQ